MTSAKIAKLQSLTSDRKNASISFSDDEEPENEEDEKSVSSQSIEYKTGEVGYSKLDQRSHILHRPDTYIGSVDRIKSSGKIWVKGKDRFECKEVYMTEGLLRVFMEITSNAIDNIWRSKERKIQPKLIEINIDRDNGYISVWNDGLAIPLGKFKDSKTGVVSDKWTPEEIFGELLTGSNYDDEEKRKTAGRNGYGSKALALGTKLLLWDGTIKTCENIKIGDRLIGDDGKPRLVTDVFTGKNKLWEICQAYGRTYTVSAGHILTLHMPDYGTIFWDKNKGAWSVLWWDFKSNSIRTKLFHCHAKPRWNCPICDEEFVSSRSRHYSRVHSDVEIPKIKRNSPTVIAPDTLEVKEARIEAEKFVSKLPNDNTIDIAVETYLSLNRTTQRRLSGLRGTYVDWPSQTVDLDPYILGMWLGDGSSAGSGFASEDVELINEWLEWARKNNSEILHVGRDDWSIRRKRVSKVDRLPVGDMHTSNENCKACKKKLCSACSSNAELETLGKKRIISLQSFEYSSIPVSKQSPFMTLLRKYNLVNNKHIPKEYLLNDRKTRLALLAGLIDTDGTVCREGTRISITQGMNHSSLADEIALLVRSLGFACFVSIQNTQWTHKGQLHKGLAKHVEISGEGVQDIPTRLPRKKCMPPKNRDTARTMGYIKISEKPEGEWVGITVDGNHRFCLDDMTVIHNCTNVLAKVFEIELFNPEYKAIYRQRWTENMSQKEPAVWDKTKSHFPTGKGKGGYTLVRFKPDYERFGYPNGLDDDMMSVLEKSIYDYAMIAALNDVSTIYNGVVIPISNLKDYVSLYYDKLPEELLQLTSEDCSVIVAPKADTLFKGDLMHVAFINGIITAKGGVHVDAWDEAIFRPIVQKLNGETKKKKDDGKKKVAKKKKSEEKKRPTIDISHVRKYFSLFIVAEANNPRFTGQNKDIFNSPPIHTKVKKSDISKLMQWSFVDRIEESIKLKEFSALKDAGKKKRNYLNIPNLDDANNAGNSKLGKECILCLTEGDSAASYVAVGMQFGIEGKIGQDYLGILPLRGKCLNVRKAAITKILKNKEVMGIIRALGLEYGVDYSDPANRNKLRYGKLYAVADSDTDGGHVTGLIINLFDTLFPSLLKTGSFLHFLRVPIVKIHMKQETLAFLFYGASQQYISTHQIPNSKKAIKYFKGLGTFKPNEIGDDFGRYPVALLLDEKSQNLLSRVFGKDDADFRKQWLLEYQDKILERKTPDFEVEQLSIGKFLDDEMRLYSIDSCIRAIPCIIDGFKESTRKIVASAFTRPLNYNGDELKVVQLAGYVAETMGYHHGEQNIPDTIIGLAQSFPGTNNIPLFVAAGNFGSRQGGGPNLSVGDDAAQPRYIFTKLEMLTRYIFREEDEIFLPDRIQDGEVVEKQYYMPIIPMLLVNGTSGIGTAHSTNVPQYNPLDLMKWIEVWLDNKGKVKTEAKGLTFYETPTLCPYYRGFTGKIEVDGQHIKTYGIMEQTSKHTWTITELPLGRLNVSIKNYCEKLKKMREEQKIKSFTSQKPTLNKPYFTVTADEDGIIPNLQNMKLVDSLTTTNMVLFDEKGKLMKFSSIEEIMEYYCARRYAFYTIRIEGMLANLRVDLKWIVNKLRFIQLVHNKKLSISNREESELEDELDDLKFDRKTDSRKSKSKKEEKSEEKKEEETSGTFDYLLSMQIKCLNIASVAYKKLEKEKAQFEEQIRELENTTVEKLWKSEMGELKTAHAKWEKRMENESKAPTRNKTKKDKG